VRSTKDLLGRLLDGGVEFVIVGGFAAVTHGVSTLTQDIEVCAPFSGENLLRLVESLELLRPRFRGPGSKRLSRDTELRGFKNLYLETDAGELDLLSEIKGVGGYPAVVARSIEVTLWDRGVRVLDLDALIDAKAALKRPKNLEVLRELQEIRRRRRKK
jgi:predicted nucleotidyltransferase